MPSAADRHGAVGIGPERRDPHACPLHLFIEPHAFGEQPVPQRLDIVDQRDYLRLVVALGSGGVYRQPPHLAQCRLVRGRRLPFHPTSSHHYLIAEISVSYILSTVVITCEAAE
jgi:hypothetical protein